MLCCVPPFVAPWTVARQPSLPMGFPRQEYWSGLPFLLHLRRVQRIEKDETVVLLLSQQFYLMVPVKGADR